MKMFILAASAMKNIQSLPTALIVLIAVLLEVAGDSLIRKCIYNYTGTLRMVLLVIGAILVFGYGFVLNLAPVEFGQVVGLYITLLFIVWQIGNYIAFHQQPSLPVVIGGTLVIAGGLIITFWKP